MVKYKLNKQMILLGGINYGKQNYKYIKRV